VITDLHFSMDIGTRRATTHEHRETLRVFAVSRVCDLPA